MSEAERHALLLALEAADGQSWGSIVEASEHTAEVMYGKQADAVGQIIAQRTADLAAKVAAVEAVLDSWAERAPEHYTTVAHAEVVCEREIRAALRGDQP